MPVTTPMYVYVSQTTQNQDNAELFVNCLEAMVETCLPGDDLDVQNPYPSPLGIASNPNLSSSMSSLSIGSLHSPTDKDSTGEYTALKVLYTVPEIMETPNLSLVFIPGVLGAYTFLR